MSGKRDVLRALRARLRRITTANGYRTDAGSAVHLGKSIDPESDPLPCIVVDDGEGERVRNREAPHELLMEWTPRVLCYAQVEGEAAQEPTDGDDEVDRTGLGMLSDLAWDIILAVTIEPGTESTIDWTLGGVATDVVPDAVNLLEPVDGSDLGGAVVTFKIQYAAELFHGKP